MIGGTPPGSARCSCGSFPLAVAGRKSKPISSSSLASAPPPVVCATRGSATTATSSACGELGRLQSCTRRYGIEELFCAKSVRTSHMRCG